MGKMRELIPALSALSDEQFKLHEQLMKDVGEVLGKYQTDTKIEISTPWISLSIIVGMYVTFMMDCKGTKFDDPEYGAGKLIKMTQQTIADAMAFCLTVEEVDREEKKGKK